MPTTQGTRIRKRRVFVDRRRLKYLLRLSDQELLKVAKAALATEIVVGTINGYIDLEDPPDQIKIRSFLGFLRERASRAAGHQLALLLGALCGDGGNNLCKKLDYCNRRKKIKAALAALRNAVRLGKAAADILDVADDIYKIIESIDGMNLPISVALFAILYALDELCKCYQSKA
mgnify:CR=1 FL=1